MPSFWPTLQTGTIPAFGTECVVPHVPALVPAADDPVDLYATFPLGLGCY